MPRLVALLMLLVGASVLSACSSSTGSVSTPAPRQAVATGTGSPGAGSSSTGPPAVGSESTGLTCANLRAVVTADIGPIGTAFGSLVGNITAHDTAAQKKAQASAARALRKLGTDIAFTAASGEDASVRAAGATVAQNVATLAEDQSYFAGITTMRGIASATSKLQTATAPIAAACQGS